MKRFLSVLCVVLLVLSLAACGEKKSSQSRSEDRPSSSQGGGEMASGGGKLAGGTLKDGPSAGLSSIAADFAVNFPFTFSSPEELDVTRFCLLKIYYEDPAAVGQDGILWVSPERLAAEVELRFGISDYQFQSPERWNVYPRYVEEKEAIAFYSAGEGPRYAVELVGQEADGEYYDYIFDVYDDFITDGHEERTLETTLSYRFRVVETADGAPFLQAVNAKEAKPEDPSQPSPNGENLLRFSLGPKGEVKALRAGDTLGNWTLKSYDAQWDIEGRDIPRVDKAVFTAPADAPVEIRCKVSLDPMSSERRYSFTVAEEDLDKMPVMEGDGRDVWFLANNSADLTGLADLGSGETRSCRVVVSRYVFVCLPMMSSNGADIVRLETGTPQNSGDVVVETVSQEEQQSYFRKYIQPYYIVGLMHSTWTSPEEIEVWRYMHFYIYNESGHYWDENPSNGTASIPADIVEDYITNYFEVAPEYLRTAENYDPAGDCYRPMVDEGHGGGPGVLIDRIEKAGDLWKFICRNEETNNRYSVTIRMVDENTFHYIAGEGPGL